MPKTTSAYLQGMVRLASDATVGITDLVEATYKRIVHPPYLPSTPIQHLITGIAGIPFNSTRWIARFTGENLDRALGHLEGVLGPSKASDQKEALLSVVNGVLGHHLEESQNPLRISMQFKHAGKGISIDAKSIREALPSTSGKILLMVHGLCMNDGQWTRSEHNHGSALAQTLGMTPVFLHYNSGQHVSTNGKQLSALLEELLLNWPEPVEEVMLLGHSMGGLVARSALHYGQKQHKTWPEHLKKMVFLGTPHHGAPLERIGNFVDGFLEAMPYAKPFARLGKIRSAGITDLRHGNLTDADWEDADRFERAGDHRHHIPLPDGIACYSIAAALGKESARLSHQTVGDGLVQASSALGLHGEASKILGFKKANTWMAYETSHLNLLSSRPVFDQLKRWLA